MPSLELAGNNLRSVSERYPNHGKYGGFLSSDEEMVEFLGECAVEARKAEKRLPIPPADAYALLAEIEYQSDNVENWIETDAYWLLSGIKNIVARDMMYVLREEKAAA